MPRSAASLRVIFFPSAIRSSMLIIRLGDGTAERCFGILRTNVRTRALCVRYWFWLGRAFLLPISFSTHYRSKLEYSVKESKSCKNFNREFPSKTNFLPLTLPRPAFSVLSRRHKKQSLPEKVCKKSWNLSRMTLLNFGALEVMPLPIQYSTVLVI